jgi:autotransporter-associated beta strand protein
MKCHNNITLSSPATATIDVGNNGSANTGNTVAFGALNNGTPLNTFNGTINFTGANGYLQSFSTLRLTGLAGGSTTLKPTTTSVTILGNVENQESGTVVAHWDTLALDGTSVGNTILGCIADATGYISVNNGDTRVTKSSTSTWTLFGTNTYHGPTTVSAGTLIIGGAGKLGGGVYTGTIAANGGLFNYASSEAQIMSGVVSGGGTISKTGSGSLTLTAVNTFSGTITNNNGLLIGVTSGTCSNSSIVVQSIGSGVTASLGVRYTAANAQWACSTLTTLAALSSGNAPALAFAFESSPSTTVAPLFIRNNLTLDASTTISVDPVNLVAGDYPLLVYGGAYSGPVPTTITPTIGNGLTGTLAWGTGSPYSAQTLVLTVSGTATSTDTLRWSGVAGTGTWDINNIVNTNWSDTATVPSYYKELLLGNPVQFEDSQITADQTVTLDSLVYPMSVIASNSLYRYTVSGNGAINGATGLTKLGTNTFTLATANTYFGPTIVNEGVLALSGLGTLGLESPLTLSGGVVDLGGLSASVGPVSITNAPASGNTIQNGNLQAASYLANLDSGTATVSANLSSAGTLTKAGAGSLVLSGTNSFVGTTVTKGFLTLSAPGSLLSGATVTVGSATPGTLTIDGGTLNCGGNHLQTGNAAGHLGAIYMNSGLVTNIQQLLVGGGANTANYGFLKISGGTWSQPVTGTSRYRIGQYGSIGLFYQTNGTFNGAAGGSQAFDIANAAGANTGVVYLAGSALINHNAALVVGGTTAGSLGVLTVSDTATAIFNGSITIGGVAGIQGFANLNGGTLQVNSVTLNAAGLLTFNGGTLKAGAANTAFNAGAGRALVFTNGVTVDTGTNRMTVAQNLLAPTGSGIETIPVLTSGSGYIGAPFVGINGDGGGATAIANMTDDGMGNGTYKIQSLTLTSPGTNYTLVTSVTLAGGGGSGATFDTAGATFVANISGGLTKQGMGTLTLSGINMYGGDTVINNGKLLGATGTSCSNSAVSVAATDGNSAVFGVSITDNTKQWTCASLTVTNNGISSDLEFDYGTIVPSLTLAPLNVIGGVAFDTLPTVTVKFGINSIGAPGTKYPLMVWDSTTGTTPTAVTVISLRAITGHLEVVGKTLTLVIDTNEPIQWALSTAGIWDTLATNWVDGADAQTTYRQTVTPGDQVIFNDNAHITAHTTVTLNSTVSPANVTVSNMVYNYAITGTGAIAGTTPVTKLGAGTLTLDTPNTYTGGTILSAGQLNINKATAIGATASRFTINGGMIDNTSAADLTLSANNPQSWNGDFTYIGSRSLNLGTGAVTPNNNRQITVSSNTLTVAGVISGAYGFTKAGNGTLTLTANNTYTGNVIVTGGNLNANGSTSLGALTSNRTITVNSGGTLSLNINNVTTGFPGNTTPALTVNGGTLYVTRYNASGMAAYNNGLTLQNGGTVLVNIPNGTDNNYYALQLGDLVTVSGTSGSVITNGVGTNSRLDLYTNTTFNVAATGGAGADLSVYAPLVNLAPNQTIPSGLIKDGAGTMALYAANTYTGPTFIKNGKLVGVTGGSINSVVTNNAATGNSTLGVLITDNIKQWSCNGLTFTGASPILDFDFGTYIFASTNLAPLKVNGVVAFTTTPTVTVSGGSISGGPGTSYPLMTWTTVSGTEPTAVTVTVPRGAITAHLEKIGSTLYLVIDTNSGTLNWATSPTGLWDTALANWKLFNGTSATYDDDPVPGDQVLFSDTFVTENTTVTLDSAVTPTSVSANNAAYNYILTGSGSITGNTSLNKSGSGIFTLGTANTYSGGTYLSGGTLALGNSSAVPVGSTLYMSGTGTLDLNGTGATLGNIPTSTTLNTITDNSLGAGTNVLSILNQPALTISALIKDGADKSVAVNLANSNAGAPTPFLLTAASTYSGGLTLKHSAGGGTRLVINGAVTTVGSAGNITSSPFGRGPIIIGEAVTDKAGLYITTATTIANELIVNTPLGTDQPYTIRVDVNTMNLSGRVTANADLTMGCQTGTGSVTLTNVISGARGVTMPAGGGTLTATLSGPNTYLGKTVVNKGTLSFNSIKNVGGGASALGAPATVADGTIDLNADLKFNGPATSSDRILNLTGTNGRLYNDGTGLLTLTQGITGNNQNFVVRGSGSITISGLIATGSGSLSRTDAGTLTLSNPLNSFSGTLIVMDGVISSDTIANSGLPCGLGQGTTIQLGQNSGTVGTLRFTGAGGGSCNRAISLWGTTATAGGIIENTVAGQTLTFSGNVSRGGTGTVARLQFSGAGNGALSGNIISNALLVQKSGAGTWTFTGNNTYTGATTVAGGTLVLSGLNGAITNSLAYAINSGAMLVLENTSAANNTNRLRDASAITLDNGTLCFTNNGGATASYRENAGALTVINSGTIVSAQAATGMTNILSLGALTRSGSATLNFVAPGLGASDRNRIFIAGQPNGLIGLWATINTTNYAAYDSSLGVIVAGTGESFTNILAKGPSIIPDDPALNAWINEEGTEGGITLAAAYTNRIKTLVQNTDWLATVAMTNKTLMVNEVLVSTGNARTLTLGTAVGEGAVAPLSAGGELLLTADATNSLLTINAAISNNTSASTVTKRGLGTVVLAGTNIFTGNLNVNSGTLLVSGSNALAGAVVNIGGVSGDAIVKMPAGSSLVGTGNTSIGSIINGNGAFYLNGGQVLRTNSDNERNFAFGSATGGYGYFSMSDGYLSSQRIALGINGNVGTALARITGGIATFNSWVLIGRAGGIGVMTIDGGSVIQTGTANSLMLNYDGGRGELNMTGGLFDNAGKPLIVRQTAGSGSTGIVNVCSGTLIVNSFVNRSTAYLNFNGGLLKAGAASTTFLPSNMTGVYVNGPFGANAGGARIDSDGRDITFAAPLIAPPGSGVTAISLSTQGSGYIGEPYVSITGDGVGATAVANMADDGTGNGTYKVDSVTVTTPGINYTTATVSFLKGGATAVAPTVDAVTLATTAPAGLTKLGLGTLTLSGTNTYAGVTTISNGTLRLGIANALPTNSVVNVNGGIYDLGGFTVTNGQVNVTSGSIRNGTIGNPAITVDDTATMTTRIGSSGLTKNGNGTLVLNGPADNFSTGPLVVNTGTLRFSFGPLNEGQGLSYWLDANNASKLTLANTNVTAWADSSTNGVNFAQGTSANQPVYVSNVINGLPALRFSGNQKMVASKTVNAQTVFIVNTSRSTVNLDGIWGATPDTGIRVGNATSWQYPGNGGDFATAGGQMFINGIAGNTFAASTPHLLTAISATQRTGWSTMIGNYYTGRWFKGDIGELLVYNSALGAVDRQSVEAYLLTKWFGVPSITNLNVSLADDTYLDLGGGSVTLANLAGSGTVSNGTLSVTGDLSPASTNKGTLTVKANTTFSGKLIANVATDGSCDILDVQGNLTLSSPTLEIADLAGLSTIRVYTLVTCSGTITGSFTSTNIPDTRWALRYTADNKVQLFYKGGTMVRIM